MKFLISFLLSASVVSPATGQDLSCPVVSAGCASYKELVKAGDEGVIADVRYVCFRESADEFFVVKLHEPVTLRSSWFWYKWNTKLADYELVDDRKAPGWVQIQTFQNGVASDTKMPNMFAFGKWMAAFDSLYYAADLQPATAKDKSGTLTIDSSQIAINKPYESQTGKRVTYSLAIQRSTKRFVEAFNIQGSPQDNISQDGRCIEIKPLPVLPEPPQLTEDQQGQRDKVAYCSDSPEPSDKGYCASPFTFKDDYEEAQKRKKTIKPQAAASKPSSYD
jgi:hypothetical protein